MQEVIAEGFSASQTLSQLHDRVVSMETLSDKQKSVIAEKMGVSRVTLTLSRDWCACVCACVCVCVRVCVWVCGCVCECVCTDLVIVVLARLWTGG